MRRACACVSPKGVKCGSWYLRYVASPGLTLWCACESVNEIDPWPVKLVGDMSTDLRMPEADDMWRHRERIDIQWSEGLGQVDGHDHASMKST